MHHAGATSKGERSPEEYWSSSISEYLLPSQYYYFRKHKGSAYAWLVRLIDVLYGAGLYAKNLVWSQPGGRRRKLARYALLVRLAMSPPRR